MAPPRAGAQPNPEEGLVSVARWRRFGTIQKVEELEDGTINVFGIASTEQVDSDGETILASAMKAALPGYMQWGAVREMHQPKAAGTALEADVAEDGRTMIGVHVVDPVAVSKVRNRVYKGFSIGGKVTKRNADNKKIIEGLEWIETSLVDRPANPGAEILIVKAEPSDPGAAPTAEEAEVETKTEEAPAPDAVKKSIWGVRAMADILYTLSCLARDEAAEAMFEGDGSPIPASLKAWVAEGGALLVAMTTEEVGELVAGLNKAELVKAALEREAAGVAAIAKVEALTAEVDALQKGGRRFSKSTAQRIANIHEKIAKAHEELEQLGYKMDAEDKDEEEEAASEKLAKVQGEITGAQDALQKVQAEHAEALEKISALTGAVAERDEALVKIKGEVATMVETLKARGVVRAVAKGADTPLGDAEEDKPLDPSDPNAAIAEMKKVHATGGRLVKLPVAR